VKCLKKTKSGFTLIEMVLVIAIIVILASVMVLSVSGYLNKANPARISVSGHNASLDLSTSGMDEVVAVT